GIARLATSGRLVWSVRSPVPYPSDAQLLPNGRILVAGFTNPGRIVELTRSGRVTWSFGASAGPDELNKPSLAVRLPNGIIAANDDWNDRVVLVDPDPRRAAEQAAPRREAARADARRSRSLASRPRVPPRGRRGDVERRGGSGRSAKRRRPRRPASRRAAVRSRRGDDRASRLRRRRVHRLAL